VKSPTSETDAHTVGVAEIAVFESKEAQVRSMALKGLRPQPPPDCDPTPFVASRENDDDLARVPGFGAPLLQRYRAVCKGSVGKGYPYGE